VEEEYGKADSQFNYLDKRYRTFRYLYEKGAVARLELVRVEGERDFARAQLDRMKKEAALLAEKMREVEAELDAFDTGHGSVLIPSPVTGYIASTFTWEGEYVFWGEELLEIVREGEIYCIGRQFFSRELFLGDDVFVIPLCIGGGILSGYISEIEAGGETVAIRILTPSEEKISIDCNSVGFTFRENE
jgi:hypothetical protein